MTQVDGLVGLIFLALKVLALVGAVYAIVHAVRQRPDAFTAVNKLTKPIWLGILIVAALILLATSPVGSWASSRSLQCACISSTFARGWTTFSTAVLAGSLPHSRSFRAVVPGSWCAAPLFSPTLTTGVVRVIVSVNGSHT